VTPAMRYRYRVAHTIHELAEDRWDAAAGSDLLMTHRWQRVMEAGAEGHRPWYVLVEDARGPLAAAVAHRAPLAGGRAPRGWPVAVLRRLTVVLSAPLSAAHCGLAVRPGGALAEALPHVERALAGLGRRDGRPVLAVNNVDQDALPVWRARGYLALPRPPEMVLDLGEPLPTYEEYFERLPSRHRHELRRNRRRGEARGVRIAHGPVAGRGKQLHPLLREVFAHHGGAAEAPPFTPALFDALEREMPGEAVVVDGSVGGQPAGFLLCVVRGDTLDGPLLGMRYDLARPSGLYFLLVDEAVRLALRHGVRRIHGGVTNEAQKARHGFRPRPRWLCLKARPGPLHALLAAGLLARSNDGWRRYGRWPWPASWSRAPSR
jgi:predicted N-acyltransferase